MDWHRLKVLQHNDSSGRTGTMQKPPVQLLEFLFYMEQRSFILYHDMWEQLSELNDEEIGKVTRATFIYHSTWEIIDIWRLCNIVFKNIKTMLDRDRNKYDEYIEKQSSNGSKWWRPKKSEWNPSKPKKPTAFSGNPSKPKKADSASDSLSGIPSDSLIPIDNTETNDTIVSWEQALDVIDKKEIEAIDHRNSGTQRIIDIIKDQVQKEWYLYDNNREERNRATIIAKRQSDWWLFIKDTPEEREEEIIRSIVSYSNQNEFSAKIRSARDFHEKWKKVANDMKSKVKKETEISYIPSY